MISLDNNEGGIRVISELTLKAIDSIKVFNNINMATKEKLVEIGKIFELSKKNILFHEREPLENVYFLLKGKVSIYKMNEFGERKVIFILNEGDMINEVLIDNKSTAVSCETFEKSTIIKYNVDQFLDVLKDDFTLMKNVLGMLENRNRRLYRQLKNSTYMKIEKKLAAKLYRLNKEFGTQKGEWNLLDVSVTVTYLADMLGCKRETLSRAMKILQNEDLVKLDGKKIYIKPYELSLFFKR